ncbi:MAG: (deoxy)nucleoside triphosphate pyrophosphohydrolase [Candidatus Omnitrophota bacterium]|jgi:mutator protein MutT
MIKTIEVGCAVIEKDGRVLIAQRNPGDSYAGYWEFPGGTRDSGESFEACVVRELQEEMGIVVRPVRFLFSAAHEDAERRVELHFYLCDWVSGEPQTIDCQDFRWCTIAALREMKLLPGDDGVVRELLSKQDVYFNRSGPSA